MPEQDVMTSNASNVAGSDNTAAAVQLSVVCPFFNEVAIIEPSVKTMMAALEKMDVTWELIVVNDGSTDGSGDRVASLLDAHPRLHLVSYEHNRGRGYALRQGIAAACGEIVVTTEIDLSWGEDVVDRLYREITGHPDTDMVVASPHLTGGGYKNVPPKRVFLSQAGNWIIRACMSHAATMNTGMTRAYRREAIRALPLEEDRKEFHLEVIMKAGAFNYRIREIPCVLTWHDVRHEGKTVKRKSSSRVNRLIVSHTLFSVFANPTRYVWFLSALSAAGSIGFVIWSVVRLLTGDVAAFAALVGLSLGVIALMFFAFGVIAKQGNMIQRELWTIQRTLQLDSRRRRDVGSSCAVDRESE